MTKTHNTKLINKILSQWINEFKQHADMDDNESLSNHLIRLNLPDDADMLIEGTNRLITACLDHAHINNLSNVSESFIVRQTYDATSPPASKYIFTFDGIFIRHNTHPESTVGRLLVDDLSYIDLADIWETVLMGNGTIFVTRTDGQDLTSDEIKQLEKMITEDFSNDLTEDDVYIWFDESSVDGALIVHCEDPSVK